MKHFFICFGFLMIVWIPAAFALDGLFHLIGWVGSAYWPERTAVLMTCGFAWGWYGDRVLIWLLRKVQ